MAIWSLSVSSSHTIARRAISVVGCCRAQHLAGSGGAVRGSRYRYSPLLEPMARRPSY